MNFNNLLEFGQPYRHWVGMDFVDKSTVAAINASWPPYDERWSIEDRGYAKKAALMFPNRLHEEAQRLAFSMYSPPSLIRLSQITGINPLYSDPWFHKGPMDPKVGGGLHEISKGGLLRMHVDFNKHPTGLRRCLNFLIYLNERWDLKWGGAVELADPKRGVSKTIPPLGGTAVMFETTASSWHGHPHPLKCPADRTRRSLALYYYTDDDGAEAHTTIYVPKERKA